MKMLEPFMKKKPSKGVGRCGNENPPVGLILCAEHNEAVVHYALGGLNNKVLASRYRLQLPDEKQLRKGLQKVQQQIQARIDHP
jgi:hypothetical protein